MPPALCRACGSTVSASDPACPHCSIADPTSAPWLGSGYEWATQSTWLGSPWIHLAYGVGLDGKTRRARGILAIGTHARGLVAVGIVSSGGLAIGLIAFGIVSVGVIAIGLGAALGLNAIAPLAYGLTAFGYIAGGLETLSWRALR